MSLQHCSDSYILVCTGYRFNLQWEDVFWVIDASARFVSRKTNRHSQAPLQWHKSYMSISMHANVSALQLVLVFASGACCVLVSTSTFDAWTCHKRRGWPPHLVMSKGPLYIGDTWFVAAVLLGRLATARTDWHGRNPNATLLRWAMQLLSVAVQRGNVEMYRWRGADHLALAGFALQCWLCSASADVEMGHVHGALSVAALVVQ